MGIFGKSADNAATPEPVGQPQPAREVISAEAMVVTDEPVLAVFENAKSGGTSSEMTALSDVERAIASIESVEDIKQVRDKAEAVRKYIASAGLGLEMQNKAAELKLRAERKAGEMLAEMKLHGGDRRSDDSDERTKLTDLGISKDQSSRWQLLARVPGNLFDEFVGQFNPRGIELTTAEALRYARSLLRGKGGKNSSSPPSAPPVANSLNDLLAAEQRFGCLYLAPPTDGEGQPLFSTESLCKLPVGQLAAEQSHLHLWTSHEGSGDANRIIDAWGFVPSDVLVWVKAKRGPGQYWRRAHELLMLGVRGECPFANKTLLSWIEATRPRNGGKPGKIRELVEAVSPGPYLELFAESTARGWQCCQVNDES